MGGSGPGKLTARFAGMSPVRCKAETRRLDQRRVARSITLMVDYVHTFLISENLQSCAGRKRKPPDVWGGEEGGRARTGTRGQRSPVKHRPHVVTCVVDILHA